MKTSLAEEVFTWEEPLASPPFRWLRTGNHGREWLREKKRHVVALFELQRVIAESRKLLDLPPDWDDEGALPVREATWARAAKFLRIHARELLEASGVELASPRILPGPDGSIDLHWRTSRRELLVNVPEDPTAPVSFYGDDFGSDKTKGSVEPDAVNVSLFSWLMLTD